MRVHNLVNWARERLNVPAWVPNGPNLLTLSRMLFGAPAVLLALFVGAWQIGLSLYAWFVLTDFLDGHWARLTGQKSAWGAYNDPAADKLFIDPILVTGWLYLGSDPRYFVLIVVIISYDIFVMVVRSFDGGMKTLFVAKLKQATLFFGVGILIAVEGGIVAREYGNAFECSLRVWDLMPDGLEGVTNLLLAYGGKEYCSPEWWGAQLLLAACVLTGLSFAIYLIQRGGSIVASKCCAL